MIEFVVAVDSKDKWVKVTMGLEEPAFAHVTSMKEDALFVKLALADHPTCGHCHLELPRDMRLEVRPPLRRK